MASLLKVNFWATLLLLGSSVSAIAATPLPSPTQSPQPLPRLKTEPGL